MLKRLVLVVALLSLIFVASAASRSYKSFAAGGTCNAGWNLDEYYTNNQAAGTTARLWNSEIWTHQVQVLNLANAVEITMAVANATNPNWELEVGIVNGNSTGGVRYGQDVFYRYRAQNGAVTTTFATQRAWALDTYDVVGIRRVAGTNPSQFVAQWNGLDISPPLQVGGTFNVWFMAADYVGNGTTCDSYDVYSDHNANGVGGGSNCSGGDPWPGIPCGTGGQATRHITLPSAFRFCYEGFIDRYEIWNRVGAGSFYRSSTLNNCLN